MGCGDEKLSKYLTQTFIAHCNAMICQQVTLSGDAEWPKVADAVIEAQWSTTKLDGMCLIQLAEKGLECLSMPDFFHLVHDIVKSYSRAVGRRLSQAHKDLEHAEAVLASHPELAPGTEIETRR